MRIRGLSKYSLVVFFFWNYTKMIKIIWSNLKHIYQYRIVPPLLYMFSCPKYNKPWTHIGNIRQPTRFSMIFPRSSYPTMALYQNIASMARRHCHTIFSPTPNLTLQNVLVARMLLFLFTPWHADHPRRLAPVSRCSVDWHGFPEPIGGVVAVDDINICMYVCI